MYGRREYVRIMGSLVAGQYFLCGGELSLRLAACRQGQPELFRKLKVT